MNVTDEQLFSSALGIEDPIFIENILFDKNEKTLHIYLNFRRGSRFCCPKCKTTELPVYDTIEKTWRHLNFFQHKCYIHLRTPRIKCPNCDIHQWIPPWCRPQSGFTLFFETNILKMAKYMSISALSELVDEYDTRIWRIVHHWVEKAQDKRDFSSVRKIGIDETSSRKGHNYFSIFVDLESKKVLFATEGKDSKTVERFAKELSLHNAKKDQITDVAVDMSLAFMCGVRDNLSNAKITFDKFHVVKELNKVVNEVWRGEVGVNSVLKRSRYVWLKNPENLSEKQKEVFESVSKENTMTAKAYQLKLTFQDIYRNVRGRFVAKGLIDKWMGWAVRCRILPMKRFVRMLRSHYDGVLEYFDSGLTSGVMEGLNSRIQEVKRRAKGFRSTQNFLDMIYLVCGGLDLGLPI